MDRMKYCISIMSENDQSETRQSNEVLYPLYSCGYDKGCGTIFINELRSLYDYFEASGGNLFEVSIYSDIELTKETSHDCRVLVIEDENDICWADGDDR